MQRFWSQRDLASNPGLLLVSVYGTELIVALFWTCILVKCRYYQYLPYIIVAKGLNKQMDWHSARHIGNTINIVNFYYWLHGRKKHGQSSRPAFQSCCAFSSCSILAHWRVGYRAQCQQVSFPHLEIHSRCLKNFGAFLCNKTSVENHLNGAN